MSVLNLQCHRLDRMWIRKLTNKSINGAWFIDIRQQQRTRREQTSEKVNLVRIHPHLDPDREVFFWRIQHSEIRNFIHAIWLISLEKLTRSQNSRNILHVDKEVSTKFWNLEVIQILGGGSILGATWWRLIIMMWKVRLLVVQFSRNDSGQVVHTRASVTEQCISCCRPKGGDSLRLGSRKVKPRVWQLAYRPVHD